MANIIHNFSLMNVCMIYDKIDISEGIDTNKKAHQKSVLFAIIGIF